MAARKDYEVGGPMSKPVHPLEEALQAGACRGRPGRWFFPDAGESGANIELMNRGVRVCRTECPVMGECRVVGDHIEDMATKNGWVWGVWGGERPFERIKRRKALKVRAA